jgi:CelD/BcsL family acetyltransferase involved in cellulose biosynthesis
VRSTAAPAKVTFETVSTSEEFGALAGSWDELVRAMPRPSPMLLHGWLSAWWRHYGGDGELAVQVAYRDGKLVGAVPLCIRPKLGLRALTFVGDSQAVLADMLIAEGEGTAVSLPLAERVAESGPGYDFVDLIGLPTPSRLLDALGASRFHLIVRSEAPVLDVNGQSWEELYRAKTNSKRRNLHKRRRRQLAELGRLETTVARTREDLEAALEDAFVIHDLRWADRPDQSEFTTPTGKRFHREAIAALAELDAARIITLTLDGRPIAFVYFFALEGAMYCNRLAFDPEFGRYSPGVVNRFDALQIAADEGVSRIEFLGGDERFKMELADRQEPLYEALGLGQSVQGRAAIAGRVNTIRLRRLLKRSSAIHRFYYHGLMPTRRALRQVARRT